MKILVVGLDCAAPELLFEQECLTNIRRLMEGGCWGRLESVIPPITVPAWICMATGQDPGSLGVYGFRKRADYSYGNLRLNDSNSVRELAVWDQLAREGKRSVVIGVPPGYPPRRINGISVGCLLTPDPAQNTYTHPADVKGQIEQLVGEYPVDVAGFRTNDKDWLKDQIYSMSRKHFKVVRHFLQNAEWDYFQFVEIGLDRMHHGFWRFHDPQHRLHEPGNPYQEVIRDYYRYLDDDLGRLLEVLTEDTAVLVVSDHGAQRLDGGFCINEWFVKEGLLVLNHYPHEITPFGGLDVNWEKTKVWGEGGYHARICLNVEGREPNGTIDNCDYQRFRDEIKERLEAITDQDGRSLGTVVFKPEEIYRTVRNIAPDLIAHFGELTWRAVGGVGYQTLYARENETGPDDCNHARFGAFILAASNCPLHGEVQGTHLLDVAPTLLELGGYDVPATMQGKSLVAGKSLGPVDSGGFSGRDEQLVRDRLRGLGYL